jgi:hypothetical protein
VLDYDAWLKQAAGAAVVPPLLKALARKAGRLLWNQWPTRVSVTYAQQHGGGYQPDVRLRGERTQIGYRERARRPAGGTRLRRRYGGERLGIVAADAQKAVECVL